MALREYWPGWQDWQVWLDTLMLLTVPGSQGVHAELPWLDTCPRLHCKQDRAPSSGLKVPAGHGWHTS